MAQDAKVVERFARDYAAGTILFHEGEPGEEMYVIRSGKVRISKRVYDGERTLGVLGAGEFFGEMAILSGKPRSATATVVEDARLLAIDGKIFETMIQANLEVAVRMIRKLATRLANADKQIEMLLLKDHDLRVASYFLGLMEAQDVDFGKVNVDVEEIAAQTGCSYAEVNDALDQLAQLGLVVPNASGGFSVPDRVALAGFLEGR
jgi:CRP-like cAMP-binding protein